MIKRKRYIFSFILVLLSVAATACGWRVHSDCRKNAAADAAADRIQEWKPPVNNKTSQPLTDYDKENNTPVQPLMDFTGLHIINNDIIAWLAIPDTEIDYPVAQTQNNNYYLRHDAQKKENKNGSLFLDHRVHSDFSDFNNVIYGHHMKSGRMFQNLIKFKERVFFESHTAGTLYTPDKTWPLYIYAVAVVRQSSELYKYNFFSLNEKEAYINMIKEKSIYYRDVGMTIYDRILALSTCSYEYTDARTVVIAKIGRTPKKH